VRLLPRKREESNSLAESDAYENSYGEHVLHHVEVVPSPPQEPLEIDPFVDPHHHVTTDRLKRQFEERLARRPRRRR
jgi:hypothetical protein